MIYIRHYMAEVKSVQKKAGDIALLFLFLSQIINELFIVI